MSSNGGESLTIPAPMSMMDTPEENPYETVKDFILNLTVPGLQPGNSIVELKLEGDLIVINVLDVAKFFRPEFEAMARILFLVANREVRRMIYTAGAGVNCWGIRLKDQFCMPKTLPIICWDAIERNYETGDRHQAIHSLRLLEEHRRAKFPITSFEPLQQQSPKYAELIR